jgi:hypothetical protein
MPLPLPSPPSSYPSPPLASHLLPSPHVAPRCPQDALSFRDPFSSDEDASKSNLVGQDLKDLQYGINAICDIGPRLDERNAFCPPTLYATTGLSPPRLAIPVLRSIPCVGVPIAGPS